MKKLLFVLALVGLTASAQAQTETPTQKYSVATNSFWSNLFIGAGFDAQAWYTDQERHNHLAKSPFKSERLGFGGDLQIGKWFTPGIGFRVRGHVGEGRQVIDFTGDTESYMMYDVQLQTLFNLNNLLCGYNPKRVWTISPYIGVGTAHHMAHNADNSPIYSVGLFNQFNLSKRVYLSLDIYAQTTTGEFDHLSIEDRNMNLTDTRDGNIGASIGLGINIGRTGWEKTPDLDAIMALHNEQMAALNKQIADQEAENDRLKNLLANRKPQTVEKVVSEVVPSAPVSVFFRINSYRIESKKDLVNVQALAEAAKARNAKLLVIGSADSKTGNPTYNQTLSEKRAETLVNALVEMGVARENIEVQALGGVLQLSPYPYNRRATVQMK